MTKKPMLCLANIDEASIVEESEGLQALREKVKSVEDAELLKLCVSLELEISTLEPSEMKEGKIRQLTIAELLGETIERIVADQSVSSLYAE